MESETKTQRSMARLAWGAPLGIVIMLSMVVAIGLGSKAGIDELVEAAKWVAHTHEVTNHLAHIERELVDAETGQRGFLYTGKENYLEPYLSAITNIDSSIKEVREMTQDNPLQQSRLVELETLVGQKLDELKQTIELVKLGREAEARQIVLSDLGKDVMDRIRTKLAELVSEEQKLLSERSQHVEDTIQRTNAITLAGLLIAFLIGIAIIAYIIHINRSVIIKIRDGVTVMTSSSSEIAATVEQHERTVTQQASAVNETTTTVEELGISARQSADQAESSANAAERAQTLTEKGIVSASRAVESMVGMKSKIASVSDQILRLSQQAIQIGDIAKQVGELATETNMLALNAAVEAARAGDQGKGFAVVASEVRKLADQSKRSAERASTLVNEIQQAINSAVMVTEESSRSADEVAASAKEMTDSFSEIAQAADTVSDSAQQVMLNGKQQAAALSQVTTAMQSLDAAAKQMAAGTEQTKLGIRQLNEVALGLKSII